METRKLSLQEIEATEGGNVGCDISGLIVSTAFGMAGGPLIGFGVGLFFIGMCAFAESHGAFAEG